MYLAISETLSELLSNHSISVNTLFAQISSFTDMVTTNFFALESGFGRLEEALDQTEGRISSWTKGPYVAIFAGLAGFIIGTLSTIARWIVIGNIVLNFAHCSDCWNSSNFASSTSRFTTAFKRCIWFRMYWHWISFSGSTIWPP